MTKVNSSGKCGEPAYRSNQPFIDGSSVAIGSETVDPATDPQDLAEGNHQITLLKGTPLPTLAGRPYVVVVADGDRSVQEAPRSNNVAAFIPVLPRLVLTEATTTDSKSITVDSTIAQAAVQDLLQFEVFRSDTNAVDSKSIPLGTVNVDPRLQSAELTQGPHSLVLLKGTVLAPDQAHQFIVVVANLNNSVGEGAGSINSAEFHIWLLGAVVHGFELPLAGEPDWEAAMVRDLRRIDAYNDVIEFDWSSTSSLPIGGTAVRAGNERAQELATEARALGANHLGDIVDLHLIGHSRGAVVASQALQDLVGATVSWLAGSYNELTLLDPHPANFDTRKAFSGVPLLAPAFAIYEETATTMEDPQVVIAPNVAAVEVDYQHSNWFKFSAGQLEFGFNLWGEGPADGIVNNSSAQIQFADLTNRSVPPTVEPVPAGLPAITLSGTVGHLEVPLYYLMFVVDGRPVAA